MRVLLWGDSAATGFGTVTLDLARAMVARGDDLRFISLNEDIDPPADIAPRLIKLGTAEGWLGTLDDRAALAEAWIARVRSVFTAGRDGWIPEATIIIGDPASVIRGSILDLIPEGFPTYHYVPIEGVGLPPSWRALWQHAQPVAMCRFGADELGKLLGREVPFVYHGVDTEAFYPVSPSHPITVRTDKDLVVLRSKADCKKAIGRDPKRLLIYRADRLMPRKDYWAMLVGLAPVLAAHPNVDLLMHCRTIDEGGNLDDFRSHIRPDLAARMTVTGMTADNGLVASRQLLAIYYNAADVYVSTGAEGFGLTMAESLACGTPVVGLDFSAVPEIIGEAGVLVPKSHLVPNQYAYFWAAIDQRAFSEAVDALVRDPARRLVLGAKGPYHVKRFSWSGAAEEFARIMSPE